MSNQDASTNNLYSESFTKIQLYPNQPPSTVPSRFWGEPLSRPLCLLLLILLLLVLVLVLVLLLSASIHKLLLNHFVHSKFIFSIASHQCRCRCHWRRDDSPFSFAVRRWPAFFPLLLVASGPLILSSFSSLAIFYLCLYLFVCMCKYFIFPWFLLYLSEPVRIKRNSNWPGQRLSRPINCRQSTEFLCFMVRNQSVTRGVWAMCGAA